MSKCFLCCKDFLTHKSWFVCPRPLEETQTNTLHIPVCVALHTRF